MLLVIPGGNIFVLFDPTGSGLMVDVHGQKRTPDRSILRPMRTCSEITKYTVHDCTPVGKSCSHSMYFQVKRTSPPNTNVHAIIHLRHLLPRINDRSIFDNIPPTIFPPQTKWILRIDPWFRPFSSTHRNRSLKNHGLSRVDVATKSPNGHGFEICQMS